MVRTNPDLARRFYLKRLLQSREQPFQQGEHTDRKISKHLKSYSKKVFLLQEGGNKESGDLPGSPMVTICLPVQGN